MDKQIKRALDGIVQECLGGPHGGPDSSHYRSAALAIVIMEFYNQSFDIYDHGIDPGYLEWARGELEEQ